MSIQIQVSIGYGSLGMMFSPADKQQIQGLIQQTAESMGYTVEIVQQKLATGGTLWLDRVAGRKIRGYDAEAAAQQAEQRDTARRQRLAADGYFDHP